MSIKDLIKIGFFPHKWIINVRRSFSSRISFFILLIVGVIFTAAFYIFYKYSYNSIVGQTYHNTIDVMKITSLKIENVLTGVETLPENFKQLVMDQNFKLKQDQYSKIPEVLVINNPDVLGCCIAFEPYYLNPDSYYNGYYSIRSGDSIITKEAGSIDYDYFGMDWYLIPKLLNKSYWTDPFYDKGGVNTIITTYVSCLYDDNDHFIGVLTADVSLDNLKDYVDKLEYFENSITFMIGLGGTFISHPDKELILNETIFTKAIELNDTVLYNIGKKMVKGQTGYERVMHQGTDSFLIYAPVSDIGWSLGIMIPTEDILSQLNGVKTAVIIVAVIGLLLIFVICLVIIRHIAKPLASFAISAKSIAHGDFNVELPVIKTKDEMAYLSDSFRYMQTELKHYISTLQQTTSAKEKIESELKIAHDIQLSFVPKSFPAFPNSDGYDVYAVMEPAKEVGGDLFDFVKVDTYFYFIVGDVSGKGVPASLLMVLTLTLFRTNLRYFHQPDKLVSILNDALCENNEQNLFVTLFVGILNLETGELSFCNAGHNPPLLVSSKDEIVDFLKVEPNIPIGIFPDFKYIMQTISINEGDNLFLYTDGLTECENTDAALYGEDRLLDILKTVKNEYTHDIVNHVFEDAKSFRGEAVQSDDLTLMNITYNNHLKYESVVLSNDIKQIEVMHVFLEQFSQSNKLSFELDYNINLVMEEIVSNIILYGYKDQPDGNISIFARQNEDELCFKVFDSGIYFNPLDAEMPDITLGAEDRQIGGLGIFIVRQIMDEISYNRTNGCNVLVMKKIMK